MPKEAGPENPSIAAPTEAPGQKSGTKESRSLGELSMPYRAGDENPSKTPPRARQAPKPHILRPKGDTFIG
jgi:hypothetical protein